ncbi:MAG: phosphatidylinositol-specific phospholipase C domain-containing protein, partial [Myxococcota bacterium]|nr:phosphatidylinositol-specific phospholipase C domain-containing protein [Myxococcota bacterium]
MDCRPIVFALLPACASPAADSATSRTCHGSAALCERPLDEVAIAMTHNSMSNAEEGWLGPNQTHGMARQLEDGVRGMMLDVHPWQGEAHLCHGFCELGAEPLAEGLARIGRFQSDHPDEVVVLMLESYVEPGWIASAAEAVGLADRAYVHPPGAPWPTLAELGDAGTPLVVFSQGEEAGVPWLHSGYADHVWDTPYAAQTAGDFSCGRLRGEADHAFFLVNHFLTRPTARVELAEEVNHDPLLSERIDQCAAEAGRSVSWVAVDFYEIGDLLPAVARMNEL